MHYNNYGVITIKKKSPNFVYAYGYGYGNGESARVFKFNHRTERKKIIGYS